MSYVHLWGPGLTHHLFQPLSTRTAQQVARGPWHRNVRHLRGQRQNPRSSVPPPSAWGGSSIQAVGLSTQVTHGERGFAKTPGSDKFPWPPWGQPPKSCSADSHWLGAIRSRFWVGTKATNAAGHSGHGHGCRWVELNPAWRPAGQPRRQTWCLCHPECAWWTCWGGCSGGRAGSDQPQVRSLHWPWARGLSPRAWLVDLNSHNLLSQ